MGLLTAADKEKIKRVIPKASNKVIDATVARLYIAYPDPTQWKYTDMYGAIVLVDDLVGHTFFLKLVDIEGHRGVIWDQELYVDFDYNQDRKFFHTFEIEDCYVGLLFEDTTEASHFFKRVTQRQKHGSKQTNNNKNAIALKKKTEELKAPKAPGPRGEYVDVNTSQRSRRSKGVLYYDDVPPPEWRSLYSELASAGITEDMIADNRDFIKDYIAKQGGPLVGLEPPIPRRTLQRQHTDDFEVPSPVSSTASIRKNKKAPPPPPPPGTTSSTPTPSSAPVPSAPPPMASTDNSGSETPSAHPSPSPSPLPSPAPGAPAAPAKREFRLPPATAVPPPVSHSNLPPPMPPSQTGPPSGGYGQVPSQSTGYGQISSQPTGGRPTPPAPPARGPVPPPPPSRGPVPPPPPRAGSLPMAPSRTGPLPPVPPNTTGSHLPPRQGGPPPPPPPRASRGPAPPPPPSRGPAPPHAGPPPSLPPQHTYQPPPPPQPQTYQPPPPPQQQAYQPPPPPPAPPAQPQSYQPPPPPPPPPGNPAIPPPPPPPPASGSAAPPPPPPPPPPTMGGGPPAPPPPPPMGGGPPAPPPPPPMGDSTPAAPLPAVGGSRDALLASIRSAGGVGALKKVDKSQLEKPNVMLQEARGEAPPPAAGGPPGAPASFADAIQNALNQRKNKVSRSDDEDDGDDW